MVRAGLQVDVEVGPRCFRAGRRDGLNLGVRLSGATVKAFTDSAQVVLVPELNYTGQYARLLRAELGINPEVVHRYDGLTFTAGDIFAKMEKIHARLSGASA